MVDAEMKSADQWDAGDHIRDLQNGQKADGVCEQHGSLVRAMVWTIRHNATKEDVDVAVRKITSSVSTNGNIRVREAKNGNGQLRLYFVDMANEWFKRAPYAVAFIVGVVGFCVARWKGWL